MLHNTHITTDVLRFESLETRVLFSMAFEHESHAHEYHASAKRGDATSSTPAIRLDLVALHEFGHSLGLDHNNDPKSIMYAYYNASYDLTKFAADSAVAALRQMYSAANVAANANNWKDSADAAPGNGRIDLTYSFVRDGAAMDVGGNSTTFATFNQRFGKGKWQSIFANELNRWAGVSNGKLSFRGFDSDAVENATYAYDAAGISQNDRRFGDIRISAHAFDGPSNVLAHAYFPPFATELTVGGDAHFDHAENWIVPGMSTRHTKRVSTATASVSSSSLRARSVAAPVTLAPTPTMPVKVLASSSLLGVVDEVML